MAPWCTPNEEGIGPKLVRVSGFDRPRGVAPVSDPLEPALDSKREALGNPLLDLVQPVKQSVGRPVVRPHIDAVEGRWRYSWAVPTEEALDAIAAVAPIVEVGAGTGYWARLLRDRGVDVVAYDVAPPGGRALNGWHSGATASTWTDVLRGDAWRAASHPDRTLMVCWPPYGTPMAATALSAYRGDRVVYIGEGPWTRSFGDEPVTADQKFLQILTTEFARIGDPILLPSFGGEVASLTLCGEPRCLDG